MKKLTMLLLTLLITLTLTILFFSVTSNNNDLKTPKIGDIYIHENNSFVVVGSGKEKFEYTSKGKTVILINLDDPSFISAYFIEAGNKIIIDPKKASFVADNNEQLVNWQPGTYLLIE